MVNTYEASTKGYNGVKKIPLTKGYEAIVDDEDYDSLMQWKWNSLKSQTGYVYANRLSYEDGYKNRKMVTALITGSAI